MSITNSFINKFKIPTLLGLGIIFLGIASGVYLTLREQIFLSKAAPDLNPQNMIFTNIVENSVVISWQTNSEAASFITWGQNNPQEQTTLDDRDNLQTDKPTPRLTHYFTLKNLLPKTRYQFKIISGKYASDIFTFETSPPLANKLEFTPIIGSILTDDGPLNDGVAYLSIPEAITQSALVKSGGNFLIPLSYISKEDLSGIYPLTEGTTGKITIHTGDGESNILFKIKTSSKPLPPIKLGQNVDLTLQDENPQASPTAQDLDKYDLNSDGKINAADNAILLLNFGKIPKDKKADLNGDGKVDQKDLDLMSQKITELGIQ